MPADSILAAARKAQAALLLERFAAVPDPDWYEALLAAALDANGGDLAAAIQAADAAVAEQPQAPPADDDSGAPHAAALSTALVPGVPMPQGPALPPVFNLHLPEGLVQINQTVVPAPVPKQPVHVTVETPPPGPTYSELVKDKHGNAVGSVTRPLKEGDGAALSVPSSTPAPPVDPDAEARAAGKLMAELSRDV